jgi:hypothetical protein
MNAVYWSYNVRERKNVTGWVVVGVVIGIDFD